MATADLALSIEQLQQLAANPEQVLQRLMDVLHCFASEDNEVRAYAADCMQAVEQVPNPIAQSVVPLCQSSKEHIANWACYALGKAEHVDEFQSQLSQALTSSPSVLVRQAAALALQKVEHATQPTVSALQQAAQSSDARLHRLAQTAIELIG